MLGNSRLKDVLLYDLTDISDRISLLIKNDALVLLPAAILVCSFLAFLFGMDFAGVLKRTIVGVAAICLFQWLFIGGAEIGFKVGDRIISQDNHLLKTWDNAATVRKAGFSSEYERGENAETDEFFKGLGKDFLGYLIWLLSNFALWFVRISFTVAYYMPLITIPVVALVNIFPFTSKALEGSMFTAIWIMVTPIVVAVLLELINGMLLSDNVMASASWISKAMMSILFALYLVNSFSLSSKMIGKSGISEGVAAIGQSFGAGMVAGAIIGTVTKVTGIGKGLTKSFFIGKNDGRSSPFKSMTSDFVSNKKSKSYQVANNIRANKPQTADEALKGVTPERTAKEKGALVYNMAMNPLKSVRDQRDRRKTAKELVEAGGGHLPVDQKMTNERRLSKGKDEIDFRGNKIWRRKDRLSSNDWAEKKTQRNPPQASDGDNHSRSSENIRPLDKNGKSKQPSGMRSQEDAYWDEYVAKRPENVKQANKSTVVRRVESTGSRSEKDEGNNELPQSRS